MSRCKQMTADVEIKARAETFHELVCKRPHHVSNISGHKVQGCELHKGDWGEVGAIVCFNYFYDGEAKAGKHLIEAIDEGKNMITLREIEGDQLKHYKTLEYSLQATPKGEGSVLHYTVKYEKLHETSPDPHSLLQFFCDVSKDIDAYLMGGN